MTALTTNSSVITASPSRRTLVRSVAWSVPVIAVAASAPAFAASPCDVTAYRLNWGTTPFTKTGQNASATVAPPPGSESGSITVDFVSATTGAVTRSATNLTVPATLNIGGLGAAERGLRIEHQAAVVAGRANRQTITITFGRAVTGLTFTITDVDSSNSAAANQTRNGWWDQIELSGSPDAVLAPGLTGTGVQGNPWKMTSNNTNAATTSPVGNVAVTYPGAVTSLTMVYWSDTSTGNQAIALSDFEFSARGC